MFGQVATFIDTLHLTYEEVWEKIPYRNLLLMTKDKMHTADAENIITKTSGKEAMQRRMNQQG